MSPSHLRSLMLAVGGLATLGVLLHSTRLEFGVVFAVMLVVGVVLDVRSVEGTRHGPFSCASSIYLAALFTPGLGPAGALLCSLAGLSARALVGPPPRRLDTAMADFVPLALTALLCSFLDLGPVPGTTLAGLVFLAIHSALARGLYPLHKATRVTRFRYALASVVGAVPAVHLAQDQPVMVGFLAALLLVTQSAGYLRIRREALVETSRTLHSTKQDLVQARREKTATTHRLERSTRERELVENLASYFARNPSEQQILQGCLEALKPLFPEGKGSLWKPSQDGFQPLYPKTSQASPAPPEMMAKCWTLQRILTGPNLVLAPLPEEGVLVLEFRHRVELTEARRSLLTILASQFALGLQSAHYRGQLEEALVLQRETNRQLQLSQEQLVQSSKMAAVGQLAAGVAHELNSPLAAALLQVQAGKVRLEGGNLEKVGTSLDTAELSLNLAQEIIDKLLSFSRANQTQNTALNLVKVLQEAWGLLREQCVQDGIQVDLELPEELPVMGSPTELQQVFLNLLVNARYACRQTREERSQKIVIRGQAASGKAVVVITDSGPGVPAEVAGRIFEPFFTTKPQGEGTGLGLAISFEILKAHHGWLDMKSTPGGAYFRVSLPLRGVTGQ